MPYARDNHQENVMELQNYLRTISRFRNNIPLIIPDGIFGPETTDAVKGFQAAYGLPQTGVVDEATWDAIYREYLQVAAETAQPVCVQAYPSPDFMVGPGASGEKVYFLQLMLISLGNHFHNIPPVTLSGRYEDDTEAAVKKVQEKSGLPETGAVDNFTWNSIARAYNIFSKPIYPIVAK